MIPSNEEAILRKQNKARMATCRGCAHLVGVGNGEWLCCDYLGHTGRMRPCSIENCTEKELRPRKRRNVWHLKTVALCIFTAALCALTLYLCPETEAADVSETVAEAVTVERDADAECIMARTKALVRREGSTVRRTQERREYLGRYWITGYDICVKCCGKTDGITASGVKAQVGRTVAAPKGFAFGTRLYIDGIGERVVEDRGGAIKGNKIDVLCEDHAECYAITGYYDLYRIIEG